MNNQTEQEFFEAFEIEGEWLNRFDWQNKTGKRAYVYPKITPEIILGLEEIIAKKSSGLTLNFDKNGMCWYLKDFGYETVLGSGIFYSRIDALLSLCIQLKDEIQNEVKELFQ